MGKPNGLGGVLSNESVMVEVTLTGDYNKLSFSLSLKYIRFIIITASYSLLGLVLVLLVMYFKMCRKEFFSEDIVQTEIDNVDVHKILQAYIKAHNKTISNKEKPTA